MMVDVQDRRPVQPGDAGPLERAALHDDGGVGGSVDLARDANAVDAGKRLQVMRRRRVHHDLGGLADRAQRERHADGRADGVAVRPLVRGEQKPLTFADARDEAVEVRQVAVFSGSGGS